MQEFFSYDLRTNHYFTLKQNPMTRSSLDDFVRCYHPDNRHQRTPTWTEATPEGRFRVYSYDELLARDKVSLDLTWLHDESLENSATLPEPHLLAQEIADDLQAAPDPDPGHPGRPPAARPLTAPGRSPAAIRLVHEVPVIHKPRDR